MSPIRHLLFAITAVCIPTLVLAHARLLAPPPRSNADNIKIGPCGQFGPGSGVRTTVAAGSTLAVYFEETIDHPGHFRVSFSLDGDGGYEQNVLMNNIPVQRNGARPRQYVTQVTIPDVSCENCGLQLIQSMEENPAAPRLYFSCADLRVVQMADAGMPPTAPPLPGVDAGATPGGDPGLLPPAGDLGVPPIMPPSAGVDAAAAPPTNAPLFPTAAPLAPSGTSDAALAGGMEPEAEGITAGDDLGCRAVSGPAMAPLGLLVVALGQRRRRSRQ